MLWLHPYQLSPCGMKVFMRDCFSFCFQWTLRTISRKSHHRVKLDLDGERRDKFSHRLSNWICSGLDKGGFIYQDWTFSEKVYAYRTTYLKSDQEKTAHLQKLAIIKQSTIFVQLWWNLVEMIVSWVNHFHQVS